MKRCAVLFLFVSAGWARAPDGTLDLIITPNNGVPVIACAGDSFEAVLREKCALRLVEGNRAYGLSTEWHELPGSVMAARCTIPLDAASGAYALEAIADRTDVNTRSVYVVDSFPDVYTVVHITDTHVGSNRHPRPSEAIFQDLLDAVSAQRILIEEIWTRTEGDESEEDVHAKDGDRVPPLVFAVITGDLTEDGDPEQFRAFVELLDRCELPTFVCPGNHDRRGLNYENTFGPLTYLFRFGEDGYLSFDTKDYIIADSAGSQDGLLEIYRRAIMPARWSIGLTHRYDPMMGMRCQLILFVDNPLDCLLYGHVHRENRPEERTVPWGTTPIIITPAAIDGAFRLVHVYANRIAPGPVVYAVSVE